MSEYNMTHTGRELDDAINKVKSGYILPTEVINIASNVSNMDITNGKLLNVNVQPSSDYIKKSDTNLYTTKFACGIYRPSSTITTSNISITVGFKPKIFYMRNVEGIQNNTSTYYVVALWMMLDNNYAYVMCKPNGTDDARTGGPMGVYYQSSAARGTWSNGTGNCLTATENGVKGNGTAFYCQGGKGFQWFAWG